VRPTRVRYLVLLSLACAAVLSYVLRVSVAPAGTTIEKDLGLDPKALGRVFAAFYVGYVVLQIPAGWVGHRFGARASLTAMGLCWAVAMSATALAHSYGVLYTAQVALGLAQSGLFAVTIMALRDWFPADRHGTASAAITSCMSVGSVLANGLTVLLMKPFGWRGTFLLYTLATLAWCLAFALWFRNTPVGHPAVNEAERSLIRGGRAATAGRPAGGGGTSSTPRALGLMATSIGMWALCTQAFFQAFGYTFYIRWFPAWLEKSRGINLTLAGSLAMLPLAGTVLGSFLAGLLIDAVLTRTGSRWLSRCGVAALALSLCAAATLAACWVRQPAAAVAVIALGMFFSGFAKPNQWAASIDLAGRHSAVGFAVMNVAGNFGAIACPEVVGRMVDRLVKSGGDWNSVLYLIAGINLAGAAAWLVLNPNRSAVGEST
jgi:MFS family permease